jgi:hypothetical protein
MSWFNTYNWLREWVIYIIHSPKLPEPLQGQYEEQGKNQGGDDKETYLLGRLICAQRSGNLNTRSEEEEMTEVSDDISGDSEQSESIHIVTTTIILKHWYPKLNDSIKILRI